MRLRQRDLALLDCAVKQQPRGQMHQPIGQAQAFGGVNQAGAAFEFFGFQPAGAVEIARGLIDQRHAVAKQRGKKLRARQPLGKGDCARF